MKTQTKNLTLMITLSSLFASLIAVLTSMIRIPTGINEGYIHFGDSIIFLVSSILPMPYSILASSIGGVCADLIAGVPIWAPATAIIKGLNAVPFAIMLRYNINHNKHSNIISWRMTLMLIISSFITILGYYIAEGIIFSFKTALLISPIGLIQVGGSALIYYVIGASLDKAKLTPKLNKMIYFYKKKETNG